MDRFLVKGAVGSLKRGMEQDLGSSERGLNHAPTFWGGPLIPWLQEAVTCGPFIRSCHISRGHGMVSNSWGKDPASRGKSSGWAETPTL